MEVFFSPQQMLWVREHATLLGCLTVFAAWAAFALAMRWLSRHRPKIAEEIYGAAQDFWRGMGVYY